MALPGPHSSWAFRIQPAVVISVSVETSLSRDPQAAPSSGLLPAGRATSGWGSWMQIKHERQKMVFGLAPVQRRNESQSETSPVVESERQLGPGQVLIWTLRLHVEGSTVPLSPKADPCVGAQVDASSLI